MSDTANYTPSPSVIQEIVAQYSRDSFDSIVLALEAEVQASFGQQISAFEQALLAGLPEEKVHQYNQLDTATSTCSYHVAMTSFVTGIALGKSLSPTPCPEKETTSSAA